MLRLMTLNINYRASKHGAWNERCLLIADAIRRVQADVVALQAVERTDGRGQAAELAALLDYEYVDFAAVEKIGATARGSAFIGRRRMTDVAVHPLSHRGNHEDPNRRVVMRVRIQTRGGALDLYNAHFSWVPAQAQDNASETVTFLTHDPAILLGDLNSDPTSPPIQNLTRAGWFDMWGTLRPAEPGYTFEAGDPTKRIDYVLANLPTRARVQSVERVGVSSAKTPHLSDHLGLVITLNDA